MSSYSFTPKLSLRASHLVLLDITGMEERISQSNLGMSLNFGEQWNPAQRIIFILLMEITFEN